MFNWRIATFRDESTHYRRLFVLYGILEHVQKNIIKATMKLEKSKKKKMFLKYKEEAAS